MYTVHTSQDKSYKLQSHTSFYKEVFPFDAKRSILHHNTIPYHSHLFTPTEKNNKKIKEPNVSKW